MLSWLCITIDTFHVVKSKSKKIAHVNFTHESHGETYLCMLNLPIKNGNSLYLDRKD